MRFIEWAPWRSPRFRQCFRFFAGFMLLASLTDGWGPDRIFREFAIASYLLTGALSVAAGDFSMTHQKPKRLRRDPDETVDLARLIDQVVPDPQTWKNTPNPVLGGAKPLAGHASRGETWHGVVRLSRCGLLGTQPLTGTWYRAIRPHFFATALAYAHTATIPGRFNPGSVSRPAFPVIYLGEDHTVTLFEVAALLGSPLPGQASAPNPANPWTIVNVAVQLRRIVDLSQPSQRRVIGTSAQELTGDWRGYTLRNPNPAVVAPFWTKIPTQRLGAALFATPGIEGFLTYSAKVPTRRNLIVFPTKLRTGSFIHFTDPGTGATHSIP
jgi:RES domain-containing protein